MKRAPIDALDQTLRAQGRSERTAGPAFSLPLHDRIMGALRAKGLAAEEDAERAGRWNWTWRIGIPLAAAAAVAVITWMMMTPTHPQYQPTPVIARETIPPVPNIADLANLGTPTADALERGKFAYLDQDAQRLVAFVTRQLPAFDPNQEKQ